MTPAADTPAHARSARRGARLLTWLVLLALLASLGWRGWIAWQARQATRASAADAQAAQWQALDTRLDAMRRDQKAQAQRLAQAEAGARVMREEVLGVGQRAALLQDSIDQLAGPVREGAKALRLDEVELLLVQGVQRLRLAGDLDGARRAYALAAGLLDGIDDPALLDLRQALAQERAALQALGADPRVAALARLEAFAAALPAMPGTQARTHGASNGRWWERALARLVRVRRADDAQAAAPGERDAAWAALQLELTLARSAAERRDEASWRAALRRAGDWAARIWPAGDARAARQRLATLAALPLRTEPAGFGGTLELLQAPRRHK